MLDERRRAGVTLRGAISTITCEFDVNDATWPWADSAKEGRPLPRINFSLDILNLIEFCWMNVSFGM